MCHLWQLIFSENTSPGVVNLCFVALIHCLEGTCVSEFVNHVHGACTVEVKLISKLITKMVFTVPFRFFLFT